MVSGLFSFRLWGSSPLVSGLLSLGFGAPLSLTVAPQPPPDDGIYWQVNIDRFHQHFRDQGIVSAVASRMDQVRGSAQTPPQPLSMPCWGGGRFGTPLQGSQGWPTSEEPRAGSPPPRAVSFPPTPDQQRNRADDAADERSHHVLQRAVHPAALVQRGQRPRRPAVAGASPLARLPFGQEKSVGTCGFGQAASAISAPLTSRLLLLPQIFRSLPAGYNIGKQVLDQYLTLLADDPVRNARSPGSRSLRPSLPPVAARWGRRGEKRDSADTESVKKTTRDVLRPLRSEIFIFFFIKSTEYFLQSRFYKSQDFCCFGTC